jgi:predicted SprT family Zn-dependent metalloprotease
LCWKRAVKPAGFVSVRRDRLDSNSRSSSRLVRSEVERLARLWDVDLHDVEIRYSTRLRSSLGRADLLRSRISVASCVTSSAALRDVLRHELAHIAVRRLGVRGERTHGPTWQQLVQRAGSTPRRLATVAGFRRKEKNIVYRHECPVCDFVRFAKRPVASWRCADCTAAGLDGKLVITKRGNP